MAVAVPSGVIVPLKVCVPSFGVNNAEVRLTTRLARPGGQPGDAWFGVMSPNHSPSVEAVGLAQAASSNRRARQRMTWIMPVNLRQGNLARIVPGWSARLSGATLVPAIMGDSA